MSLDERSKDAAKNDELQNLPERPIADASQVKGGASVTPPPGGPVPIPYPSLKVSTGLRSLEPCL
jgi:hypothetical protein